MLTSRTTPGTIIRSVIDIFINKRLQKINHIQFIACATDIKLNRARFVMRK